MTVHVGELTSEVVPEDEPRAAPPAPDRDPEERLRETHEWLAADAARTRAEGFDD